MTERSAGGAERIRGRKREGTDELRLIVRIARLYHQHGLRQPEIARRLHVSQARVSRVLQQAEVLGIVRTTVVVPDGIHAELEEGLEASYGLTAAHVLDFASDNESELAQGLGVAAASAIENLLSDVKIVAFSSWSATLAAMVEATSRPLRSSVTDVVEALGGIGAPTLQHQAAHGTQQLAECWGAQPVFLRVPGIVASSAMRAAVIEQDTFVQEALNLLDRADMALIGIGPFELSERLHRGGVDFGDGHLEILRDRDVVGNVNLRFFDSLGRSVQSSLDDLVIGMTLEQLRRVPIKVAAAGGAVKRNAIRGALLGRFVDVLITDEITAIWLLNNEEAAGPPLATDSH